MVVRLEGKIDGQNIIFQRKDEGDWWETTIPPNLSGIYIVELVATDEAGNQGFATKYILTIDLDSLYVHLKPLMFYAAIKMDKYSIEAQASNYCSTINDVGICSELCMSDYYASIAHKAECEEENYGNCS